MQLISKPLHFNHIFNEIYFYLITMLSTTSDSVNNVSTNAPVERLVSSAKRTSTSSLQLTPLWEHVLRTQTFPDNVNIILVFNEIRDRLCDPEWEVRQHALRVLTDVIPVVQHPILDQNMAPLLSDLTNNLGNQAPAVRKGALDSLRMYLLHSKNSNEVLQTIAHEGLENVVDNNLQGNLTVGLILSLPSLIFPQDNCASVSRSALQYIISLLCRKLVQITYQEITLRTLVKIRQIIGEDQFNEYLDGVEPYFNKTDFNLLCQVYNISEDPELIQSYPQPVDMNVTKQIILAPSKVNECTESKDVDNTKALVPYLDSKKHIVTRLDDNEEIPPDGKVILKTEIKLNSETAITMTILEEKDSKELISPRSECEDEFITSNAVVKILDDSEVEEDFSNHHRTPRRVRFGGEVVKLRTPDSDTIIPSDDDLRDDNGDIIEVTLTTDVAHEIVQQPQQVLYRSYIPLPITPATEMKVDSFTDTKIHSAPNSPIKSNPPPKLQRKLIYQSSPDLTKQYFNALSVNNNAFEEAKKKKYFTRPTTGRSFIELPKKQPKSPSLKVTTPKKVNRNRADKVFSPIPVHEQVEMLHNLQADSIASKNKNISSDSSSINSNSPSLPKQVVKETANTKISKDVTEEEEFGTEQIQVEVDVHRDQNSKDETESHSSSSASGSSGGSYNNEKSWEDLNLVDTTVINDLHNKEDWSARVRGREALLTVLRTRDVMDGVESRAASFLHLLFATDRHSRVLAATKEVLYLVIDGFSEKTLQLRLAQIAAGLARLGGPDSVQLATQLMQKLTPAIVTEQFVSNYLLSGRSSKVKENAMQIVIYSTLKFPSTEFNVASLASRVALAMLDRKRRVRQAALETLAVLGQIGSMDTVLDAVTTACVNLDQQTREAIISAVRTRLVRRQLPVADENFIVTYAPIADTKGFDMDWIYAGVGSMSPNSAKIRANAIYRRMLHSAEPIFHYQKSNEKPTTPLDEKFNSTAVAQSIYEHQNLDKDQRPKTSGCANELNTNNSQWPLSAQTHNQRFPRQIYSSNVLRPVYGAQTDTNSNTENDGKSFPILSNNKTTASNTITQSHHQRKQHTFKTSDSFSSESSDSPRAERFISRRDHSLSGIPIPIRQAVKYQQHTTINNYAGFSNRNKTPRVYNSQENSHDSSPEYVRQQSESNYYITPPAESYLPPIDINSNNNNVNNNNGVIRYNRSQSSLVLSSNTSTPQRQFIVVDHSDESSPVRHYKISLKSTSHNNLTRTGLENGSGDLTSSSAYVTSDRSRSTSYDNSPIKSDRKSSDSDFDIDANEEISNGYKTGSSGNISNISANNTTYQNIKILEYPNSSPIDNVLRKNINSAPAHASFEELDQINDNSNLDNRAIIATKSLPGSIVDLNHMGQLNDTVKKLPLHKRQKINAKQTANKLLNGTTKSISGSSNVGRRISVVKVGPSDISQPFDKPKEMFNATMNQLESSNWESTMTGLQNLKRLIQHHSELIEPQMHPIAVALARHIRNLRSQVARTACLVASYLFTVPKKALEMEMEEIATPLLHKTADTNKFLRADANTALDSMCTNMSVGRVTYILATRGATHQNAIVRCATARLLEGIVDRLGCERVFQLQRDIRDRIIVTSANLLTEGSLETRNHVKKIFKHLMAYYNFQKVLLEVVPACTMRHISKSLKSIK